MCIAFCRAICKQIISHARMFAPLSTLSLAVISNTCNAESLYIVSEQIPQHQIVANTIAKGIHEKLPSLRIKLLNRENIANNHILDRRNNNLIISIGTQPALAISKHIKQIPVLYTLIPKPTFELLENSSISSAIYIEQPLDRTAKLIKALDENFRSIGILLGQSNKKNKCVPDFLYFAQCFTPFSSSLLI